MKCYACEYEYEEDWTKEVGTIVTKGDEKFITINGMFLVENSGWNGGKHEIYLYACPKCQTVRIDT